eukprot:SAG11_NODE_5628_length_1503_cov_2.356125_3_plen_31_part_01
MLSVSRPLGKLVHAGDEIRVLEPRFTGSLGP